MNFKQIDESPKTFVLVLKPEMNLRKVSASLLRSRSYRPPVSRLSVHSLLCDWRG